MSSKNESATDVEVEDTDDDGNETDKEIEVTEDNGEEEFDANAFAVLLAAGKADCLEQGISEFSAKQLNQRHARQRQREMQRAANRCEPLTSYFSKGACSI